MNAINISTKWKRSEEWKRAGKGFLVSITRHESEPIDFSEGKHRWAVYAWIYPQHPLFVSFTDEGMFQPATSKMPLHGGCSYFHRWFDGDKCSSIQVGADYHHLHDADFTKMETADDAGGVFDDAEALFNWLETRAASL